MLWVGTAFGLTTSLSNEACSEVSGDVGVKEILRAKFDVAESWYQKKMKKRTLWMRSIYSTNSVGFGTW